MKRVIQAILYFGACSLLVYPALASQRNSRGIQVTGVYSNIHYVEGAGDLVGMEVFISRSRDGYHANVQIAEGVMFAPVLVDVTVNGSNIEFTLPEGSSAGAKTFEGRITSRGLTGKFRGDVRSSFLKRKRGYWQ